MTKIIGIQTDMDGAVGQWLDNHHIRAKDVYSWSATGQSGDITTMTVSFYVSGVVVAGPDAVDMTDARPDSEPATVEHEVNADEPATVVMDTTAAPWDVRPGMFDIPRPFFQREKARPYGRRPGAIRDNPQG